MCTDKLVPRKTRVQLLGKEGIHLAVHSLGGFKYCMPEIILFELCWPLIWRTYWPCCSRELSFEISYSFWSSNEMGKSGDLILMSSFIQRRKMKSNWGNFKGQYGDTKIVLTSDQITCLCIYPMCLIQTQWTFKNTYCFVWEEKEKCLVSCCYT